MNNHWTLGLLSVALLNWPVAAQALTLQIDANGILTGASDVDVSDTLYDVRFLDGSCISLFTGCDESTDFAFTTAAEAMIAAQALLDQVFTDTPLGQFDSDVDQTNGCTNSGLGFCGVYSPFAFAPFGVEVADLENFILGDFDHIGELTIGPDDDLTPNPAFTFAVWSLASAPEPGTLEIGRAHV